MKKFLRKFYISFVITSCVVFGFLGVCIAYENIRATEYGDTRRAIEIKDNNFKFFDYEINFNNKQ